MIDFRYHLVSLVSVFIALAIGVVLGAGPLRGPLSDTLTTQVEALRDDKANLQQAVTNRDTEIAAQNEALQTVGEQGVTGALAGRRVLQVVLPGADPADVVGYADLLRSSGAQVSGTVTINPGWSDPAGADVRSQLVKTLTDRSAELGVTVDAKDGVTLARLLTAATVTSTPGAPRPAAAEAVLNELTSAKLVTVTGTDLQPADLVVVLSAGPTSGAAGQDSRWQAAEIDAGAALVHALKDGSGVAVVSAPVSSANGDGLLAELRQESAGPTTVDGVSAASSLGIVLGLVQQASGGVGHYGTGEGASAVLPPLPQPGQSATPSGSGTP